MVRFGPLLALAGEVKTLLATLDDVVNTNVGVASLEALAAGENALAKLLTYFEKLPPGRDRDVVELQRQEANLAILVRVNDFLELWRGSAAAAVLDDLKASRKELISRFGDEAAYEASQQLIRRTAVHAKDALHKAVIADAATQQLFGALWGRPNFQLALTAAFAKAAEMRDSLVAARQAAALGSPAVLDGLRWPIRGVLGEIYALSSPAWIAERDKLMKEARTLIYDLQLGPGYSPVYLTQAENGLRLNVGQGEGPDAVVAILGPHGNLYPTAVIEVKTAAQSKAPEQILESSLPRMFGRDNEPLGMGMLSASHPPGATVDVFIPLSRPSIPVRAYLIAAHEGTTSARAIERLTQILPVAEWTTDVPVSTFTAITDTIIDLVVAASP
jgi:hypothetical protein